MNFIFLFLFYGHKSAFVATISLQVSPQRRISYPSISSFLISSYQASCHVVFPTVAFLLHTSAVFDLMLMPAVMLYVF